MLKCSVDSLEVAHSRPEWSAPGMALSDANEFVISAKYIVTLGHEKGKEGSHFL